MTKPLPSIVLHPNYRNFFWGITLSFPLLLFLFVEIFLRIVGFGLDIRLFTQIEQNGQKYSVMNPSVKNRYFSKVEFSPATSAELFQIPKPEGTYRIFCLGASTTVGYPYGYAGSFPTFLRTRLQALFPEKNIEVINLGLTATNSFTVADLIGELDVCGPDLIIVYDGHNEFYGALGVASRESVGQARWLTRLYLASVHSRTFMLARDLFAMIGRASQTDDPRAAGGTMMERLARGQTVSLGDPVYEKGKTIFRDNLAETADAARRLRVPLLLGTQVSNLRDLPPFVSSKSENIPSERRSKCESSFAAGRRLQADRLFKPAADSLRAALQSDSARADIWFALGTCLVSLHQGESARTAFTRARDLDMLRFRASSDFNREILGAADERNVFAVDIEGALRGVSEDSLVGSSLILEHLHPNLRGSFLVARTFAGAMRAHALLGTSDEWKRRDTLTDETLWNRRVATPLDEMIARRKTDILISGWPFTDRFPSVPGIDDRDTLGQIVEQVTRGRWNADRAHRAALAYYEGRSDSASIEREYRYLVDQSPRDVDTRLSYAQFLFGQARWNEMRRELMMTLPMRKTVLANRALGDLSMKEGHPAEALPYYREVLALVTTADEKAENGYLMGIAFARLGSRDSARVTMERVLAVKPDYPPALKAMQFLKN